MVKESFKPHIIGISALFVLGQAGITLPFKNSSEVTFLGFLISAATAFFAVWFLSFLLNRFMPDGTLSGIKKYLISALDIAVLVFSVYVFADCFEKFCQFISLFVLPETPQIVIGLLFAAVIAYLAVQKREVLYKLGLIAFFVSAVLLVVLFLFSVPRFEFKNIFLLRLPKADEIIGQAKPYLTEALLPLVILPFYVRLVAEKKENGYTVLGVLTGIVFLSITLLSSLLIFGSEASGRIEFPYSEAIGTVTVGDIFTRMDGFSYFVFFSSCFVKCEVCIAVISRCIKNICENLVVKK